MKTNKFWSLFVMLVLVLGSAVAFSSCSKDDDNGGGDAAGLVGTWYSNNGQWTRIITFKSNGTFSLTKSSLSGSEGGHEGTYRVKGTTVTCTGPYWTLYADGTYDVDDNYTITYTYSNGSLNGGEYTKR